GFPIDRIAPQAAKITKATVTTYTVPGNLAAQLPYQVAPMTRTDDYRYILEYPSNVTAGGLYLPTWYAWARGENAKPASEYQWDVTVTGPATGDGKDLHVDGMGIIQFSFEPLEAGTYTITLLRDTSPVASANLTVASP
ncbi:MAG TPA: hypothetical protein VNZ52_05000, partial [Candidatus Thermoplasmatota archaeon]|nr:hypothetical protein [Candidatus Thermoplasmatota archaeon]